MASQPRPSPPLRDMSSYCWKRTRKAAPRRIPALAASAARSIVYVDHPAGCEEGGVQTGCHRAPSSEMETPSPLK